MSTRNAAFNFKVPELAQATPAACTDCKVAIGLAFTATNQNREQAVPQELPPNTFGFLNHFALRSEHKRTAERFGLGIQHHGLSFGESNRFTVSSAHGPEALSKLAGLFTSFEPGAQSVELDRKTLVQMLNFLRQPIDQTLGRTDKRLGHHASRFLTTGKIEIPLYVDSKLENAKSLDCHLKGQRKMQEGDVWNSEDEIANPKLDADDEKNIKLVSSIPNTAYDPKRGFVFRLHPSLLDPNSLEGANQRIFASAVIKSLHEATGGRYRGQNVPEVAFNTVELKRFYTQLGSITGLPTVITQARVEERAQALYEATITQARELEGNTRFHEALVRQSTTLSPEEKLKNLLLATSILTPVMRSDAMLRAWKHAYYMEYKLKLTNPVEDIPEQLEAFDMVARKMLSNGNISPAEIQALINNNRTLLSFAGDIAESLAQAAQHNKESTVIGTEKSDALAQRMQDVRKALDQASVNGVASGEAAGYYEELLSSMRTAFGQNGNVITHQAVGAFNTWKGFWQGVLESVNDSPAAFVLLASLVGYAYYTKYGSAPDPETLKQAVDAVMVGWDGGDSGAVLVHSAEEVTVAKNAAQQIINGALSAGNIDEVLLNPNVHYNRLLPQPILDLLDASIRKYLQYRHWTGSNVIANNAMTLQEMMAMPVEAALKTADIDVNHASAFRDVSKSVTQACGLAAIDLNTFQDGSHATMGGYAVYRGAQYGAGACKGMFGLAAEFINPTRRLVESTYNFSLRTVARTVGTAGILPSRMRNVYAHASPAYHQNLIATAAKAAEDTEGTMTIGAVQEEIKTRKNFETANIKLNIGWYGLNRKEITIGPDNITTLERAINELALTLQYSAEDIGIESRRYANFVLQSAVAAEAALQTYKASEAPGKLETLQAELNGRLQNLMGAELKFNQRREIYDALFPLKPHHKGLLTSLFTDKAETIDQRRRGVLERHAAKKHGRLMRQEDREKLGEETRTVHNKHQKPERLASMDSLNYAWESAMAGYKNLGLRAKQGSKYVADVAVFIAREGIQEPIAQLPLKRKFSTAAAIMASVSTVLDIAGVKNIFVQAASGVTAGITSMTTSSGIFIALNIPQDAALHTVAVGAAIGLGTAWFAAVKRGLNPLAAGSRESVIILGKSLKRRLSGSEPPDHTPG